jgi:excisionase family DNA binding protein
MKTNKSLLDAVDIEKAGGMVQDETGCQVPNDYSKPLDGFQGRLALRPKEAAAALGIGNNAIYELCNRSGFPVIQLGNKKLIPVDGLRRWLEDQIGGRGNG